MQSILKDYFIQKNPNIGDEIEGFCQLFVPKIIKKKEFLLQVGEVCEYETFIVKGLIRVFQIDKEGKEQTLTFAAENWWACDFDSFQNQVPSQLYIQALEDSQVLQISHQDKEKAYHKFPILQGIFRELTLKTFIAMQRRMLDNLNKTAIERYWDFFDKYPKIAQRLTNIHMASYLGVTHEFVSKIRKKS